MNLVTPITRHLSDETISAFIDAELSPAETQRVRQHLAECHECALRVLSATELKNATAHAGRRFAPSPESFARVTAHLRSSQPELKTPARAYSFRPMIWSAIAAAVLLAVSLLGWRQFRQNDTLAAELLDQHLATLSTSAVPQVVSSDKHTVKPWFQGRLPFSFNLPEAATLPPDTVLNGADLTYFNGHPAALLLFTVRKHQVSVLLMQKAAEPASVSLLKNRAGFTIQSATTSELRIIAVSDVNPADLDRLVAVLVQAQGAP
jgi:anti-sigma factor RsiW